MKRDKNFFEFGFGNSGATIDNLNPYKLYVVVPDLIGFDLECPPSGIA